ncbi:MAG: hypothetical protein U1B30_15875 [Pseudomonadota bacterium]|nr:hypothetical protein [Pseudomonadota bacterium]
MPKYHVSLCYTLAEEYDVEAPNEEEAIEEAKRQNDQETNEEMMARSDLQFADAWAQQIEEAPFA